MFAAINKVMRRLPRISITRKRTILFKSIWLHGTYTVEVQSGDDVQEAISARIVELLPNEPDYATIKAIRMGYHHVEQVW